VLIGIGSSNRYNLRNPFTFEESEEMVGLSLEGFSNYQIFPIPDLDDGPRWRSMVRDLLGPLDLFLTDNPYVAHLMADIYPLAHPSIFLPPENKTRVDGTMVRLAMAKGCEWKELVPEKITTYLVERGLDDRFRKEFGLQTLSQVTIIQQVP